VRVGDLVRTPRFKTVYLIIRKRDDLLALGEIFVVQSVDGKIKQSLNRNLLEVISESR
jgi:hypothetical protein